MKNLKASNGLDLEIVFYVIQKKYLSKIVYALVIGKKSYDGLVIIFIDYFSSASLIPLTTSFTSISFIQLIEIEAKWMKASKIIYIFLQIKNYES